jgi:hypothetical protein
LKAQRPKVEPIRKPTLFQLERAFEAAAMLKVERPFSLPGILLGTSAFTAAGWEGSFYPVPTSPQKSRCGKCGMRRAPGVLFGVFGVLGPKLVLFMRKG